MKKVLFLMALTLAFANENLISIYTDQTIVTQKFIDANRGGGVLIPEGADEERIMINADCDVSATLKDGKNANDERSIKWQQDLKNLSNKLDALSARGRFIEHALIDSNKSNDVTKRADEFYKLSLENYEKISAVKSEIKKLEQNKPESKTAGFAVLDMKFACEPKEVKISYPYGDETQILNEIYADTKAKNILINQKILVTNPFASDVKNLKLTIYPTRYQKALAPSSFYPWYEESEIATENYVALRGESRAAKMSAEVADMRVQRAETEFAKIWKIDGINLEKGESKYITYDTQKIDANFSVFADFYGSLKDYNVASFELNDDLAPASTLF